MSSQSDDEVEMMSGEEVSADYGSEDVDDIKESFDEEEEVSDDEQEKKAGKKREPVGDYNLAKYTKDGVYDRERGNLDDYNDDVVDEEAVGVLDTNIVNN